MSSRLARDRKEKGERKRDEAQGKEEQRRHDYVKFMAEGLKTAFDLDRRSESPRERQAPPASDPPPAAAVKKTPAAPPPTINRLPVEITPGLRPPARPVDKNPGATNNGPVDNLPGPPADMIPARPT
ncbi:hypothetical protein PEX2_105990 [Penicillium expansum]|uniref:Uncharacterized protein n=1 Tax=Penicillium expansum TaxID=27334 RepID=A0A0A2JCA7_PENEN|nr:hypothetical protein PEX2_105990 [Penicillium expansum]KGO37684.1 hypothetical protein PEXP_077000 [Penicillium expansum]KGO49965.1 hypothetical protein PEX2_105990 [Penicillium expansum]